MNFILITLLNLLCLYKIFESFSWKTRLGIISLGLLLCFSAGYWSQTVSGPSFPREELLKAHAPDFLTLEQAQPKLIKYLKKHPDNTTAWDHLAKTYIHTHNFFGALYVYRHLLALESNNPTYQRAYATLLKKIESPLNRS